MCFRLRIVLDKEPLYDPLDKEPVYKDPLLDKDPLDKDPLYDPLDKEPVYKDPLDKDPLYDPLDKDPLYDPLDKEPLKVELVSKEPLDKEPDIPNLSIAEVATDTVWSNTFGFVLVKDIPLFLTTNHLYLDESIVFTVLISLTGPTLHLIPLAKQRVCVSLTRDELVVSIYVVAINLNLCFYNFRIYKYH